MTGAFQEDYRFERRRAFGAVGSAKRLECAVSRRWGWGRAGAPCAGQGKAPEYDALQTLRAIRLRLHLRSVVADDCRVVGPSRALGSCGIAVLAEAELRVAGQDAVV